MKKALTYIETNPPKKIENLVIFIHGYGSSGNDLISLTPYFQNNFPDYHFISPNAPYETGIMENSYFWFPIENFDRKHLQEGVDNAIPILDSFINSIIAKYEISYDKIILCGFSQGTLLSLHYGLNLKTKLKAILGFSGGALPSLQNSINNETPICLIHGDHDEVLPHTHSLETAEILRQQNHNFDMKIIPYLGHSINEEAIEFAIKFLKEI